jgi:hypothetical protein
MTNVLYNVRLGVIDMQKQLNLQPCGGKVNVREDRDKRLRLDDGCHSTCPF